MEMSKTEDDFFRLKKMEAFTAVGCNAGTKQLQQGNGNSVGTPFCFRLEHLTTAICIFDGKESLRSARMVSWEASADVSNKWMLKIQTSPPQVTDLRCM